MMNKLGRYATFQYKSPWKPKSWGQRGRMKKRMMYRQPVKSNGFVPPPELKFIDTSLNLSPVTSTGAFVGSIVIIAEGDGESDRDGRKISVTQVTTKLHLVMDPTAGTGLTGTHNAVKVCLVLDTQVNGATPATLDYEVAPTTFLTFRNLSNSQRFKTLWTRIYTQNTTAAAGDGAVNDTGSTGTDDIIHYKFKTPLIIQYNNSASTGAVSTQESNGLFLYFKGRHNFSNLFTTTRVRFYG